MRKDQTYSVFLAGFHCHISIGSLKSLETLHRDLVFIWCFVLIHTYIHCHQFYPLSMTKQSVSLIKMLVFERVLAQCHCEVLG